MKKINLTFEDRELEEMEERHQMEVKVYKQKVKHLLYEQENHLAGLKAENMVYQCLSLPVHQSPTLSIFAVELESGQGGAPKARTATFK